MYLLFSEYHLTFYPFQADTRSSGVSHILMSASRHPQIIYNILAIFFFFFFERATISNSRRALQTPKESVTEQVMFLQGGMAASVKKSKQNLQYKSNRNS